MRRIVKKSKDQSIRKNKLKSKMMQLVKKFKPVLSENFETLFSEKLKIAKNLKFEDGLIVYEC